MSLEIFSLFAQRKNEDGQVDWKKNFIIAQAFERLSDGHATNEHE